MTAFQPWPWASIAPLATVRIGEDLWLEAAREDDFLGVQPYTRMLVGPDGGFRPAVPNNPMGFSFCPTPMRHRAPIRRWSVPGFPLWSLRTAYGRPTTASACLRRAGALRAFSTFSRCIDCACYSIGHDGQLRVGLRLPAKLCF